MIFPFQAFEIASLEELAEGVMEDPETKAKICLKCGRTFETGEVFEVDGRFWEAEAAARSFYNDKVDCAVAIFM